ncbi:MAG: DNA replication/repair protein RecF [Oscillospiraceae bacterium]|nr:DNA replication/repair protein RecF [Oscillospiraceae bacterium]
MKLESLCVTDYRNIKQASLSFSDGLTVICGKNGQGKTNLLESIWLLTGSKSFRGAKDAELIRKEANFAIVNGTCSTGQSETNIHLLIGSEASEKKGRTAKTNGVDIGRATNLAGIFTAVVFEPGHLSLVKGSPDGRRKMIDAAICQLYPSYLSVLRKYTRLITQKNALLKSRESMRYKIDLLDVLDKSLAQNGTEISRRRREYLEMLYPFAKSVYQEIAKGSETLALQYQQSFGSEGLAAQLLQARETDLRAGFCTAGPHREDFTIFLSDTEAKTFASQGQQRSCVLSLKLAEAAVANAITGEHPVMLFDDVLSELDHERQAYLLDNMENKQTIVTACDAEIFHKTGGAVYEMNSGQLTQRIL